MIATDKKLGIIGGMGSWASANLYSSILKKSPARTDREHIEIIIHNNSRVPDRTQGILYGGEDAFPEILRSAKMMDTLQVDYLLIACVTAHYYCEHVQQELAFSRILNLLDIVRDYIQEQLPGVKKIGLLATTGVVKTRLWHDKLQDIGVEVLCLPPGPQENLFMNTIYGDRGVKSGVETEEQRTALVQACELLTGMGADAILASCSELPLVLRQKDTGTLLIDVFDVLTDHAVKRFY